MSRYVRFPRSLTRSRKGGLRERTPAPRFSLACTCTRSQGSFLSGSFSIRLDYEALSVTSAFIPWHSTASEVQTVIENLYPDNKLGSVTVTRAKYAPGGDDSWGGGFTWVATFLSLREDVPAMQINPALSGLGAAIGDAGANALLVAAESFDGSENGEVNEVQLIDCECAATCSGSFKLSFRGEQTTEIAHSASAADVRRSHGVGGAGSFSHAPYSLRLVLELHPCPFRPSDSLGAGGAGGDSSDPSGYGGWRDRL